MSAVRAYHTHGQRRGAKEIPKSLRFSANQSSHTKSGTHPTSYRFLLLAGSESMYVSSTLCIRSRSEHAFAAISEKLGKIFNVFHTLLPCCCDCLARHISRWRTAPLQLQLGADFVHKRPLSPCVELTCDTTCLEGILQIPGFQSNFGPDLGRAIVLHCLLCAPRKRLAAGALVEKSNLSLQNLQLLLYIYLMCVYRV